MSEFNDDEASEAFKIGRLWGAMQKRKSRNQFNKEGDYYEDVQRRYRTRYDENYFGEKRALPKGTGHFLALRKSKKYSVGSAWHHVRTNIEGRNTFANVTHIRRPSRLGTLEAWEVL